MLAFHAPTSLASLSSTTIPASRDGTRIVALSSDFLSDALALAIRPRSAFSLASCAFFAAMLLALAASRGRSDQPDTIGLPSLNPSSVRVLAKMPARA